MNNNQARRIQRECLTRKATIGQAISNLEDGIGRLTQVRWRNGTFRVIGTDGQASFETNVKNRQEDRNAGLAVAMYDRAEQNGELHFSRRASTCHHMQGIEDLRNRYQGEYREVA